MNRRPSGFTIIEVLIAAAILSIFATFVLGGVLSAMTQTRRGFDRAQAAAWIQSELDFFRVQDYGAMPVTVTPRRIPDPSNPMNDPSTGYLPDIGSLAEPRIPKGFYQAEIELTDVAGVPFVRRLTARLYQTPSSPAYTILVTYISQFTYP